MIFATMLVPLAMISACEPPEPPRTVSDLCLNINRISADPAPAPGVDDPGNIWDTDLTFQLVLELNNTIDRLCPGDPPAQ